MAAGHDPRDNDRLVSLRARFEEAVDRMIGGSEWHGADLTTMAESACRRLDELIAADFGPKYDGNYLEPVQTCTEIEL